MASGTTRRLGRMIGGGLVAMLLIVLTLGSGVVSAQEHAETGEAADLAALSEATMISLDLTVTEITDPGTLWLDEEGLHIRGLSGISSVSGDITGTAETLTDIDWAAPCNAETLVCLGTQTTFTKLTITNEQGNWTGNLQLAIDPANATDSVGAVLIGQAGGSGGAAGLIGQALYLNAVTNRTDVSLSLTGYRIAGTKPVGGVQLIYTACMLDSTMAVGGFQDSRTINDSGVAEIQMTSTLNTDLGTTIDVAFNGAKGLLTGTSIEMGTAEGGSAGRFVLMGVDGEYAGYLGIGRTGSQLVENSLCASGIGIHSFWIGEIYIGS